MKVGDKVKFKVDMIDYVASINEEDIVKIYAEDLEGILIDFDNSGNPIVRYLNPSDNKSELRVFEKDKIQKA